MKKLKIAVIGCGGIAKNAHFPAYLKMDDVEIVAGADLIPGKAEKFFQRLCDALGSPKVVVMELDKILGKPGEQNKFSHGDPAES